MRRLAWTFTARIGYKFQIRLTRSIYKFLLFDQALQGPRFSCFCLYLNEKLHSTKALFADAEF